MVIQLRNVLEYQLFKTKVEKIDFHSVRQRLFSHQKWTQIKLEQEIHRYQQLLFVLNQYPQEPVVPDRDLDQVVHAHIATGKQYVDDCQMLFHRHLEHGQGFGTKATDRLTWQQTFHQTQVRMAQFPVPPRQQPAYCVLRLAS
jgi:hypothetical protein